MTANRPTFIAATAVLAAALMFGCDNDTSKPKEPKVDTTTPNKPALPSVDQIKADAAKGIEAGKAAAASAAEKVKAATPGVIEQAKETTASAVDATKTNTAAATEMAKAQGSELMAKLDAAIKENKLDQGQTYVDALERIKTNLPEELRTRYEQLKTSFQAAKAKVTGTTTPPATPAELNK
jgi:hypothetical protein